MTFLKTTSLFGGLLIGTIFMMNSCGSNKKTTTKKMEQTSGIQIENLDKTANLGEDFYQYATGGWQKLNPLTGEYSRFGSFDKLAENNRKQLKGLIEGLASKSAKEGTIEQKIGDLFNIAMDSVKLNNDGYNPIKADLAKIAAIKDQAGVEKTVAEMFMQGRHPYFYIGVEADPKSSKENLLQTGQGGIGLGQRDYYLENDDNTKNIREKYQKHIVKMFELEGFDAVAAEKNAADIMRIETRLAKSAYDNVKLRDPQTNYNKMTVAEAQKLVPEINWSNLLANLDIKDLKELSISQKENMQEVGKVISTEPIPSQIAYLQWNIINASASFLSDEIYNEHFNFFGKVLSGRTQQQPRWKRAVSSVDGSLGEAVGQMYVKKYFPPAAKERMEKLVKNLQVSLAERIKGLTWMGDATKAKAIEKLNAFYVKVGYPNKWRDYSNLAVKKDSYWENVKRVGKFESDYNLAKLGKPVDKDEWLMTPQTVNAYYNPTTNEICFPAGILQYPFFDMNADDAFNYGAIGVVIGHEMTHGFDDQGRQFDKEGNLADWWTADDAKKFTEHANQLADFYGNIEVAPGVHANGKFTLGENIADQGGLQVSFYALQNVLKTNPLPVKDGYTPEQRFYLAYANVWAGNVRPEEIQKRTKTDPHSLGKWRVDAALPQVEGWYKAFNIKPTDKMYVAPDKRAIVW